MSSLLLVQGLYFANGAGRGRSAPEVRALREEAFAASGDTLGIRHYEWVDGRGKTLANRLLRLARGTAPAVDAVELIELEEARLRAALAAAPARALWQQVAACAPCGLDVARSFVLMGAPRQVLNGPAGGQRLLWFGRGLGHLSEAEFIGHYTGRHGTLVASYAPQMGLRRYRQVPSEQDALCDELRQLGLGRAAPPAVFAELVMGPPPFKLASLRMSRAGAREIKADEQRHIDFKRSMLLLARRHSSQSGSET